MIDLCLCHRLEVCSIVSLIWTSFFCCRHYSEGERCRVPAISSNGYPTDYWRWRDPGTYETVLGRESGRETRLSRDKENYAQSSRKQRHVSCLLHDMLFTNFLSNSLPDLDILWLNSFFVFQESLKQTWTNINRFLLLTFIRSIDIESVLNRVPETDFRVGETWLLVFLRVPKGKKNGEEILKHPTTPMRF